MRPRFIQIRGARTHNLKGVDASLPLAAITAVTGVSGSGKSSLAFDTLYAESQRRFVESLSVYARQFLERLDRPDVDRIESVPPAIAIGQGSVPRTARTTVGSMSQLLDLLELLFGAVSIPYCVKGHGPLEAQGPSALSAQLQAEHPGARLVVVTSIESKRIPELVADGYHRALGASGEATLLGAQGDPIQDLIIDRLVVKDSPRLAEAIQTAYRIGRGSAALYFPDSGERRHVEERPSCGRCGAHAPRREARLFSTSSAIGACPSCQGFGKVASLDLDKVVPDASRSLLQDAIAPWSTPARAKYKAYYHRLADKRGLRLTVPWQDLSKKEQKLVLDGDAKLGFPGVRGFFAALEEKRYKMSARILIARYRGYDVCSDCDGQGLRPESLSYRVGGRSIAELRRETVENLRGTIEALSLPPEVEPLRERIRRRLSVLERVGLGYLTLDREARTLSSGEARRVHLSGALGAGVTGTLYVLDEPSVGLHPRDTARLGIILRSLTEAGNTVVVVEHDTELIELADHVLELGPGAGRRGGELLYSGSPAELRGRDTATGRALMGPAEDSQLRRATTLFETPRIEVHGARARNLADFDIHIPKGALTCISGVSGSGKSTLLHEVLAKNLPRHFTGARLDDRAVRGISGMDEITGVHVIDASPLSRSSRSIPATYLNAWTEIRKVLAASREARTAGLTASDFSFNSGRGRCEVCLGLGYVTVDMQFLADVEVRCEACGGRRFKPHVRKVRWRDHTVVQILEMSVEEAYDEFGAHPAVRRGLEPMLAVGLSYLPLGQPTSTLSAGEAQRLKLAAHLAERGHGRPLLLLDEPTTGLHLSDVARLLAAFDALIARGATVVVVEHNLEVLRHAHHVIDLGPDGGALGGRLLVQGSVLDLLDCEASHTAAALTAYIGRAPAPRIAGHGAA